MKSMCHDVRRNSPSVTVCSPASCCRRTTSAIAASSARGQLLVGDLARGVASRASSSGLGRSRLPTWSARNGGVVRSDTGLLRSTVGPASQHRPPWSATRQVSGPDGRDVLAVAATEQRGEDRQHRRRGRCSPMACRSAGEAPSSTQAKNTPAFAGPVRGELLAHLLRSPGLGVVQVDRLELLLLVVEVGHGHLAQVHQRASAPSRPRPSPALDAGRPSRARACASAVAIVSCSASICAMVSRVTPTGSSAGQAISCSPSWWSVSCWSKLSQARAELLRPRGVTGAEGRQRLDEPVEVPPDRPVDDLVHAHLRHGGIVETGNRRRGVRRRAGPARSAQQAVPAREPRHAARPDAGPGA